MPIDKIKVKRQSMKKNQKDKEEIAEVEGNSSSKSIQWMFDPPTNLPTNCLFGGKPSFVEDRRWVGKRASEIVEKKYLGYNNVTNEELSLSFKQAWNERIAFCKADSAQTETISEMKDTPSESKNKEMKE